MTTMAAYIAGLEGLSITGVTMVAGGPPGSPSSASLPLGFVNLPSADNAAITFGDTLWPTLRADLVILVEPVSLNLSTVTRDDIVTIMDNVTTALAAADITKSKLNWTMRLTAVTVSGIAYRGLVTQVTGHG